MCIITIMRKACPRPRRLGWKWGLSKIPSTVFCGSKCSKTPGMFKEASLQGHEVRKAMGKADDDSFTGLGKILFHFISWRKMQSVGGFWERKWQEPPYIFNRTTGEQIVHGQRWKQSKGMAWTSVVTMGMEIVIGFWYILKVWPAGFANGLNWGVWQKEDSYGLFLKLSLNSWKVVWGRFCLRCASVE